MMNFTTIAAVAFAAAALATPVLAADPMVRSGTITIDEAQFGFLVGGSTGGGVLHFEGKSYPFKIGGINIGTIGGSHVKGFGTVYNLKSFKDFPGTYVKAEASATAVKGSGALKLKKGDVVLEIDTNSKGLQLSANGGGVDIKLK